MKKKLTKIFGIGLAVMLLASLMLVSVPVGALTQPTVSLTDDEISAENDYTLLFSTALDVAEGGKFVIVFPADTDLTNVINTDVTMSGTSGLGSDAFSSVAAASITKSPDATTGPTLTAVIGDVNDDDKIGRGTLVEIVVADVRNPSAIDTYTLTVSTTTAGDVVIEAAVESTSYTTTEPTVPPLPGVIEVYNPADVHMSSWTGTTAFADALDAVAGDGWTLVVGPGTYTENPATALLNLGAGADDTIIMADGDAIVVGDWAITHDGTILSGLLLQGTVTANAAADVLIEDCAFSGDSDFIVVTQACEITGCTFDVEATNIGVDANDDAEITGCAFTVEAGAWGVDVADAADGAEVTDCTFTGASGVGCLLLGDTDVTGCTFDGLETAIEIDGGTQDVTENTITGCGDATSGSENPAIDVDAAVLVTIIDNTIADCVDEILNVAANEDVVFMNFNAINNPAAGITSAAASVDCANNLWDGGVAPPVTSTNAITEPYLTAAASNATMVTDGSAGLDARTTVGVQVTTTNAVPVMVANYASNPGTAAVPGTATAYFDVYASGDPGDTTISLFGTVDANTIAYVWGAGLGEWVACSDQAVNIFAGSVTITVDATSIPTTDDLVGLPLALAQPAAAPPTVAATTLVPAMGTDDVSVDPTFAWGAVTGAISYDFALAEDNPLAADPFDIIDYSAQTTINAHPAQQTLKYSTTYYWRVRAVTATETGPWTTGLFTTEAEPVEEEGGDIIVDVPDITVDSPDITVQPAEVDITVEPAQPVIPDYLLWVIIAVGAVLVIALIVLIVRTRRTA